MEKQIYLDPKESAVLIKVYEFPDGDIDFGELHKILLESKLSKSYEESLEALENTIARGFIRGKRGKADDDSIYYAKLKLTTRGEQVAIRAKKAAKGITFEIVHVGTGKVEKINSRGTARNV